MTAAFVAVFTVAAVAGWAFVIGFVWRTRDRRRSALWWHLTLFTGVIAVVFTLAVVVRVVTIPGIDWIALALYSVIAALLVQRAALMYAATKRDREP